jgi:hypothetical protein
VSSDGKGIPGLVATLAAVALGLLWLSPQQISAAEDAAGTELPPTPVQTLFKRLPVELDGWTAEGSEGAIALQMFPFAGREDLVARFKTNRASRPSCAPTDDAPLETIAQHARQAQIVIINEAHHQPFHRYVIQQLGVELADEFSVFAAETFDHLALETRTIGQITDALGSYSDEPIFGRELRALENAGYRFVAYEIREHQLPAEDAARVDRVIAREEAQAENLIAEVLREHPAQRILVHVGYSHALEKSVHNFGQEIEWFAARLKRKTGIDPLTISQTHCVAEDSTAENALDGLRIVDGEAALQRPGAVDIVLAHPTLRFERNRPAWRYAIGDMPVEVPESLQSAEERVIIEARKPEQDLSEVPVDRLLLYPGEAAPLMLPAGEWQMTAWTEQGKLNQAVHVVFQP